mmetsp:Transcript_13421/g.29003  ORF Transcript_13421/g.29003 Transcript_13421/m.29003 type:complete len:398 (+) Transcript_13421:149-1342(+)
MLRSQPKRPALIRSVGERFAVVHDDGPTSAAQPSSSATNTTGTNSSAPVVTNKTSINDDNEDNDNDNASISSISCDDNYDTNAAIDQSSLIRGSIARRTIRIDEERTTLQKLEEMTRHLEQATIDATTGPPHNNTQQQQYDKSEVVVDIVATLTATNQRHQQTISQLERRLSESESRNKDSRRKARSWKKKHSQLEKRNYELIQKMATKYLAQMHDQDESRSDWKAEYQRTNALYENLTAEYASLIRRCQRLEAEGDAHRENEEQSAALADELREENEALHASIDGTMRSANDAAEKMGTFVRFHEKSVADFERRLGALNDELGKAMEEKASLVKTVEGLREENEVLLRAFEEAEEYFDRDTFMESNREKAMKEENKRLKAALLKGESGKKKYTAEI